jgi:hypothetical protein
MENPFKFRHVPNSIRPVNEHGVPKQQLWQLLGSRAVGGSDLRQLEPVSFELRESWTDTQARQWLGNVRRYTGMLLRKRG